MAGWYDSKNTKLDVDSKNITTSRAATTKAVSDAFLGIAKVIDDREKLNLSKEQSALTNEKNQMELNNAYAANEQKAIDDTYLKYVDPNTGKFNQEQLDNDNVGLPTNQVSLDARTKQKDLQNAYDISMEKVEKKAQEEVNNEIAKELFKYKTKDEFNKNVNQDLIRYADGNTMLAVDKHYNDNTMEMLKLNNAKSDLANQTQLSKLQIELAKEKATGEYGKPREVKAADDSLISKNISTAFGGIYNPATGAITGLDKDSAKTVSIVSSNASKIFKENKNLTHNEASAMALKNYEDEVKVQTPIAPKKELTEIEKSIVVDTSGNKTIPMPSKNQGSTLSDNLRNSNPLNFK